MVKFLKKKQHNKHLNQHVSTGDEIYNNSLCNKLLL